MDRSPRPAAPSPDPFRTPMVSVDDPPRAQPRPPADPPAPASGRGRWWWVPGAVTVVTILSVIVVTLSQLHPSLLLTNTTTTGGDTGAHIAMPKFMESLLSHGRLTGWDPGWYDGFPLYTFYFTLPDLFIAVGRVDRALRHRLQARDRPRLGPAARSVPGPAAGSSGSGRRSPRSWPRPRCRSSSTTRSPSTAGTCSRRLPASTHSPSACRSPSSSSACSPVPYARGGTAAWAALALAGCVLSHIVPGFYALGGAVVLTAVELLPARWGIGDYQAPDLARRPRCRRRATQAHALAGRSRRSGPGSSSRAGGSSPSGSSTPTPRPWTTRTSTGGASSSPKPTPGPSSWPGWARSPAIIVRSRFGITVTVLGVASAARARRRPAGRPLQRAAPAAVVHLGLPHGRLGVRGRLHRRGRVVGPGARPPRPQAAAPHGPVGLRRGVDDTTRHRPCPAGTAHPAGAARPPALAPGRGRRSGAGAAGRPDRRRAAVRRRVLGAGPHGPERGHQLVDLQLPRLRGADLLRRVPLHHRDDGHGDEALRLRPRPCGSTARARTGSGRPRRSCSCPTGPTGASTPWRGCSSSPPRPRRTTSSTRPSCRRVPRSPRSVSPTGRSTWTLGVQHLQLLGVKYFMAETPQVEAEAAVDPDLQAGGDDRAVDLRLRRRADQDHLAGLPGAATRPWSRRCTTTRSCSPASKPLPPAGSGRPAARARP